MRLTVAEEFGDRLNRYIAENIRLHQDCARMAEFIRMVKANGCEIPAELEPIIEKALAP